MNNMPTINEAKLALHLFRFAAFVEDLDGFSRPISFRDSVGYLGREEDYKTGCSEEARKELNFQAWDESWIGSGKIAACAQKAIGKAKNLVDKHQQVDFRNRLDQAHEKFHAEAEQVLYDIYRSTTVDSQTAFNAAIKTFGAKYETIAFLFFAKNDARYLPVSTGHIDKSFALLGIDFTTTYKCGWDNYMQYIEIVREIRTEFEQVLPLDGIPRLIDAHSFLWIIQQENYHDWTPSKDASRQIEQRTEWYLNREIVGPRGSHPTDTNVPIRSSEVVRATKERANGICQLCRQPAPFNDKKGRPYLEAHHVQWLSEGGADSTANTVALCPNCHARIHVLDRPEDRELLEKVLRSY